jgi:hypothetical protein
MVDYIKKYYTELNCPEILDERFSINYRDYRDDTIINKSILDDIYKRENIHDCQCDTLLVYKDENQREFNINNMMPGILIGQGLYGKVFDLCEKDEMKDCQYVIKYDKNGYNCNEISIQILLGKTGIAPKIYEVWRCLNKDRKTRHSITVMEKCDISLMDILKSRNTCQLYKNKYGEDIVGKLFINLINILREINDAGIYHNDNHLDNFMLKDDQIKIIDFGQSCIRQTCSANMSDIDNLVSNTFTVENISKLIHSECGYEFLDLLSNYITDKDLKKYTERNYFKKMREEHLRIREIEEKFREESIREEKLKEKSVIPLWADKDYKLSMISSKDINKIERLYEKKLKDELDEEGIFNVSNLIDAIKGMKQLRTDDEKHIVYKKYIEDKYIKYKISCLK